MSRKRRELKLSPAAPAVGDAVPAKLLAFLDRYARVIAFLAVLAASMRIAATWTVFSQTSDEPVHVACGVEWLDKGRYTCETQHPPLARVAAALGPYLLGARYQLPTTGDFTLLAKEGIRILSPRRGGLALTLARAGVLPFFWVACWVVFAWGIRYFNRSVAVLAVLIFSFTPTVLAHAGLATTDMALTAFLGAAFLTLLLWADRPTLFRAALFGLCIALMVLSKFSSLVFFPAAVALAGLAYVASERPSPEEMLQHLRAHWRSAVLAAVVCCFVVWAGYRFSFGKVDFAGLSLPAPELYAGIHEVSAHNQVGHDSFLLGEIRKTGWWYFFPVVLAVKTPLALLLLIIAWAWLAARKRLGWPFWWIPLVFAAALLTVGMASRINIGLRHILPIYIAFSLMAAAAGVRLLEKSSGRWLPFAALALIGSSLAASSLLVHPDYLAYFNELAGDHPENIVVDSDLDWGQDFKRLGKRLQQLGADRVTVITYYLEDFPALGIRKEPIDSVDVVQPPTGWTAISVSYWKITRLGLFDNYPTLRLWPDLIPPAEHVGRGILLWYFPPASPGRPFP